MTLLGMLVLISFFFGLLAPDAHNWLADFLVGGATMWIFSAVMQALEVPDDNSGKLYRFFYRFVHLLGANLVQAGLIRKT